MISISKEERAEARRLASSWPGYTRETLLRLVDSLDDADAQIALLNVQASHATDALGKGNDQLQARLAALAVERDEAKAAAAAAAARTQAVELQRTSLIRYAVKRLICPPVKRLNCRERDCVDCYTAWLSGCGAEHSGLPEARP